MKPTTISNLSSHMTLFGALWAWKRQIFREYRVRWVYITSLCSFYVNRCDPCHEFLRSAKLAEWMRRKKSSSFRQDQLFSHDNMLHHSPRSVSRPRKTFSSILLKKEAVYTAVVMVTFHLSSRNPPSNSRFFDDLHCIRMISFQSCMWGFLFESPSQWVCQQDKAYTLFYIPIYNRSFYIRFALFLSSHGVKLMILHVIMKCRRLNWYSSLLFEETIAPSITSSCFSCVSSSSFLLASLFYFSAATTPSVPN